MAIHEKQRFEETDTEMRIVGYDAEFCAPAGLSSRNFLIIVQRSAPGCGGTGWEVQSIKRG